jgi:transcriptional regulator with GAF, ATPase, and Fis domain
MPYNCNICNKQFISNSGFWKHNQKYHQSVLNNDNKIMSNICQKSSNNCQNSSNNCQNMLNNKFKCDYCNKICNSRQSKWYYIKKCKKEYDEKHNKLIELENKNKLENDKLKNEIDKLKNLLQDTLKVKPNILNKINKQQINNKQNNTINNNNNNNTINIVKFGTEDLQNIFTEKQMFNLINKGGSCINESIKYIHFNDKKPEYVQIKIL